MAVDKKDRIYPGDSLPLVYECQLATPDGYQVPATPLSAFARILNKNTGDFLIIGPVGVSGNPEAAVTITPETAGRGAILTYIVSDEVTNVAGNYKVFITAVFADGTVLTEDRDIRVMDFR